MQIAAVLSTALLVGWFTRKYVPAAAKPVYLIDTFTYKPPDRCASILFSRQCLQAYQASEAAPYHLWQNAVMRFHCKHA